MYLGWVDQNFYSATPPRPPACIDGPSVWYGSDVLQSGQWVHRLSAVEIAEIESAVERVRRRGLDMVAIGMIDFELPTLGPILTEIEQEVVNGRGFVLIRGLPVERYSIETTATAFWGIGSYFGWAVSQNARGHVL